jgi:hypothetical protein
LEQNINSHPKLDDEDRIHLQQYITRAYGSLTTFNVLFAEKKDYFKGQGKWQKKFCSVDRDLFLAPRSSGSFLWACLFGQWFTGFLYDCDSLLLLQSQFWSKQFSIKGC